MDSLFSILFEYGLPLLLLYLAYKYIWKDALPNISFKGWSDLAARYHVQEMVPRHTTITMRVGSQTYNFNNMEIAVVDTGIYLQRTLFGRRDAVHIPYANIKLRELPKVKKMLFFNIPVYGLFDVDGVDLWIDSPYAERISQHLS
jgi:hypothetical protein